MTKRYVPILHHSYRIYQTEEFKRTINETYANLQDRHGIRYADSWHQKITDFIEALKQPSLLGTIDPLHFSDIYAHRQVPDTQTTLFFLVERDVIYLITSGYSGRNWPNVLSRIQPAVRSYKRIKTTSRKPTTDDNGRKK